MIIGQFVDTYPPAVDGVGRVTLAYCRTLKEMGHETYYVAPRAPRTDPPEGTNVLLSASLSFPGELFRVGVPDLDPVFLKKLRAIPFDIVHAQSPFLAGMEASRIARKRDIPLVSTFHSKYYDDVLLKTHSKFLAREVTRRLVRFYDQCDGVWTVNNATAQVLHDYGYRGHILVMENGTNREKPKEAARTQLMEKLHLKPHVPILLFVGQHNYKKNLHGVLGACRILKEEGKPFQLITAGDGPDFDAIVEEAKSIGIGEDCTFLGFIQDRDQLMHLYALSDLLVFPSLYDNAPMVLREAAVMGTPGLLVKNSCASEGINDGYNGFIAADESARAIADAILRGLPMAQEAGARAADTIPVSWEQIMQQVLEEYERLIDCHGGEH